MIVRITVLAVLLTASCAAASSTPVAMGDGQIGGAKIKPYEFTWRQCAWNEGDWVSTSPLTERAVVIGDHTLRVRQNLISRKDQEIVSTTYFDRSSLSPLRMEQDVRATKDQQAISVEHVLRPDGYSSVMTRGGETKEVAGAITSEMFHGAMLGLPLVTLDWGQGAYTFEASMVSMKASYAVTATLAGREVISHDGKELEALLVDVEWTHNELGDVYPPGPDASGGRYWLAQDPPVGMPYVLRYKTDTYTVEFIGDTCPESKAKAE